MSIRVFEVPSLADEEGARGITSALRLAPGIIHVTVSLESKQVSVDFDSALINEAQVIGIIRDAGHEVK